MWKWLRWRRRSRGPDAAIPRAAPERPDAAPPLDLRALGEFPRAELDPVDPHDEADLRREVLWAARAQDATVPAFPALATRLLEQTRDPDVDLSALVRSIQQDPAITAQVLRFASSPVYGGAGPVEGIRDAVTRLGLREVSQIVATVAVLSLTDSGSQFAEALYRRPWSRLRRHAVVSAFAASWLALERGGVPPERAFLGGLLHDVGKLVVLQALSGLDPGPEPLDEHRLAAVMEGVHGRTGPAAIQAWGLPGWLADLAAHHHDLDPPKELDAALVHIVRAASGIDELRANPHHRLDLHREVDESFDALSLTPARRRAFIAQVATLTQSADALLAA